MRKYLILGATGLLGTKLLDFFTDSHGTFFESKTNLGSNVSFLDINRFEDFKILLDKAKPDVVINCTGMTKVDMCEKLPEKSWKLNCFAPVRIAQECGVRLVKYVHISTDHFSNPSEVRLKEYDSAVPINQYGLSKLSAEKFICSVNEHSMIIRSNFFHFNLESPKTFLDNLIYSIKEGKVSHSFSDILFTPISTFQLAVYIQKLVEKNFAGVINISSSEVLSKFDFHSAILRQMKFPLELHLPALLDSLELLAVRPRYMALDNNLLQKTLGAQVPSIYDMIKTELKLIK